MFETLTCGLIDSEVKRRADAYPKLIEQSKAALAWLKDCAAREKAQSYSKGYGARINALESILRDLGEIA